MAVIKQLNERNGTVTAIVEVNGVIVPVELNKGFKSHLERNKEVIKRAKRPQLSLSSLISKVRIPIFIRGFQEFS